ncbi:MAG TPA: hypothetical protein VI386_08540 [Candidatus Sulfotelmatobacter sp.]
MKLHSPFRLRLLLLAISVFAVPGWSESAAPVSKPRPASSGAIVIGFVGGFVRHDNARHGPVLLAQRIRQSSMSDAYVQVFENRHRKSAYRAILRALDTNHDGILSAQEKINARIVLYGQSWGASAAVLLARDLWRQKIPVKLTVQVDSVAKFWQDDSIIPQNVAEAVNYFQPHGLIHGRPAITAADPSSTRILGNYLVDYRKNPVACSGHSWFDLVTPSHAQSECDTKLWSKIEDLVWQSLGTSPSGAMVNLQSGLAPQ